METLLFVLLGASVFGLLAVAGRIIRRSGADSVMSESFLLVSGAARSRQPRRPVEE
jgi:hypothetical protein